MLMLKLSRTLCLSALAAMAQSKTPTVPPLTATVEDTFVRTLANGNSVTKTVTGQFYRDAQGRTRIERGQLVTLQDPTTGTTVVIDLSSNAARRFTAPHPVSATPSMSTVAGRPPHQDLGTQVISGVPVKGVQSVVTLPPGAIGNLGPITETSEVWYSGSLALAVETKSTDLLNGEHTELFTNIVSGASVDPALFSVPGGVQITDVQPSSRSGSQKLN